MKYYIGIDLGGTNIVAGVVNESYEILAKASVKTNLPRPEEEIAADMAKVSQEAAEKAGLTMADIEWIGVGTPGVANSRHRRDRIFQQYWASTTPPIGEVSGNGTGQAHLY